MSKHITNLALVGCIVLVAACTTRVRTDAVTTEATAQEFVIVQPEPISVEPAYTGKFK
ncbi:MAG: hypothetical protein AAF386_02580 [Pseudomonadota bacterium]